MKDHNLDKYLLDIKQSIKNLLTTNTLSFLLVFLSSIIIFRNVNKEHYGVYVILISSFAIVELLLCGFNESILRFLGSKITKNERYGIIQFVFLYKYILIITFSFLLVLAYQFGFVNYLFKDLNEANIHLNHYIYILILNIVVSTCIGILTSILNAHQRYKYSAKLNLVRNLTYLLSVFFLSFYSSYYLDFLLVNFILGVIVLIYLFRSLTFLNKNNLKVFLFQFFVNKKLVQSFFLGYSGPLVISSSLTYIKNHLPVIVLGSVTSLENVATFSVIKTIFKVTHSISGSFFEPMTSKFRELKEFGNIFKEKLDNIFLTFLLLRLIVATIIMLFSEVILNLYKIDVTNTALFVMGFLAIEYVIAGMVQCNGLVLKLDKNTYKLLLVNFIRALAELFLIFFFLAKFQIVGAAAILSISRFVELTAGFLVIKKQMRYSYQIMITFSLVILISASIFAYKF